VPYFPGGVSLTSDDMGMANASTIVSVAVLLADRVDWFHGQSSGGSWWRSESAGHGPFGSDRLPFAVLGGALAVP